MNGAREQVREVEPVRQDLPEVRREVRQTKEGQDGLPGLEEQFEEVKETNRQIVSEGLVSTIFRFVSILSLLRRGGR